MICKMQRLSCVALVVTTVTLLSAVTLLSRGDQNDHEGDDCSFLNGESDKPLPVAGTELRFVGMNEPGATFDEQWNPFLKQLKLDSESIDRVNDTLVLSSLPVFVTAISESHAGEVETLLSSWNTHFAPFNLTLTLVDLGLSEAAKRQLTTKFGSFLQIVPFDFTLFPQYVRNLMRYRFKALIAATILSEHAAIFWMDASIVWTSISGFNELLESIGVTAKLADTPNTAGGATKLSQRNRYPTQLFLETHHSEAEMTHPGVYKYFPSNATAMERMEQFAATAYLMYGTKQVRREITKWLVLCALEEHCFDPPGARLYMSPEDIAKGKFKATHHLHRFDQSVLNLLLAHANGNDWRGYVTHQQMFHINKQYVEKRFYETK